MSRSIVRSQSSEAETFSSEVDVVQAIGFKRDGKELDTKTIDALISGYVNGSVPDYQMSALLMAIVLRGLTKAETLQLTRAMVESGDVLDPGSVLGRKIVDKHSTGGVGDKVSLVLAPIVAACSVPFGKMSGRGLGHTGGTLDKLEAIHGFNVELTESQFLKQIKDIGLAIAGQTGDLVPADKKLYALRDVTGTVESIPLIAASIMSKKLASGADAIVLDVKVGSGAFMKNIEDARLLADEMIAIGKGAGREVQALLTDMSCPLGRNVGNALEIIEVVELLDGAGPPELRDLVVTFAGMLLSLSDLGISEDEAVKRAEKAITSGDARMVWDKWIRAQGGDPSKPLELAPIEHTVLAHSSGVIKSIDALEVGLSAVRLGAGRRKKDDAIDHGVGIKFHATVGDKIEAGVPLFTVFAREDAQAADTASDILNSIEVSALTNTAVKPRSVIIERRV